MTEDGGLGLEQSDEFAAANETPFGAPGLRDNLEMRIDRAREVLARGDDSLRRTVRERPFVAVGMALAIGYLIGRGLMHE